LQNLLYSQLYITFFVKLWKKEFIDTWNINMADELPRNVFKLIVGYVLLPRQYWQCRWHVKLRFCIGACQMIPRVHARISTDNSQCSLLYSIEFCRLIQDSFLRMWQYCGLKKKKMSRRTAHCVFTIARLSIHNNGFILYYTPYPNRYHAMTSRHRLFHVYLYPHHCDRRSSSVCRWCKIFSNYFW